MVLAADGFSNIVASSLVICVSTELLVDRRMNTLFWYVVLFIWVDCVH